MQDWQYWGNLGWGAYEWDKSKYPDALLLFRVGDFYETFGEDAIIASRVLGITLTRIVEGCDGYVFKEGDILCFFYLCRCCRKTASGSPGRRLPW